MDASSKLWAMGAVGILMGAWSFGATIRSSRDSQFEKGVDQILSGKLAGSLENSRERLAGEDPFSADYSSLGPTESSASLLEFPDRQHSESDSNWEDEMTAGETRRIFIPPTDLARVEVLLRGDPVAALEAMRELPATGRRDELLEQAVMEWAGLESTASVQWVRQVQPAALQNRLMGAVALGMATRQPDAAARLAAEEMLPGSEQNHAVAGIVQRWIQSDPDRAAAWIEQFPQTALQRVVVEILLRGWLSKNSAAALQWVDRLPEGGLRTQANWVANRWTAHSR